MFPATDRNGAFSRRELFEAIEKVACHLNARNVQQGDFVVIALPNGTRTSSRRWRPGNWSVLRVHVPQGTDEERNHIHALFERKLLISSWDCDEDDCVSGDDVRAWIEGDFPNGVEILPFFACEPSRAIRREGRRESRSWWYRRSGRPTARWICRPGRR